VGSAQVFLRNSETGLWYAGADRWVAGSGGGRDFGTVEEAIDCWRGMGVDGVEVVLHYDDPQCDLVLPLSEQGR
jgi:hypothetical protein